MKPAVAVAVASLIALARVPAPCRAQEQPPANAPAVQPPAAAQAPAQEIAPPLPAAAPQAPAMQSDDRSAMQKVGEKGKDFGVKTGDFLAGAGKKAGSFFGNAGQKTGTFFKGMFAKD